MASPPSAYRRLWIRWKMLDLPWRKKRLIGFDLAQNTYWEFNNPLGPKPRRIVHYPTKTPYSNVKVPPAWMQWLRYTRDSPPSITEQQQDVARQVQMKELARLADERWASKPSMLDPPSQNQPVPAPGIRVPGGYMGQTEDESMEGVRSGVGTQEEVVGAKEWRDVDKGRFKGETKEKGDPWKVPQTAAPGEDWQPKAWTPGPARRGG